ncbi:MAG: DUF1493 family protein [Bacteroidia bacterium]|jgi:hypothetical protein|nr:DUF1493 family protein [Bacteroidia bacterium]
MEKGKSRIDSEEILTKLLKKYSGKSNAKHNDDLEWDLGLTGDDAFDFLVEYGNVFNVDISKFPFHEYFYDEGHNIVLIVNRIFRRYKKKKFTIENLFRGIEEGQLN